MDNVNFVLDILKVCNHKYIKYSLYKLLVEDIPVFNSIKTAKRAFEDLKNQKITQRIEKTDFKHKYFKEIKVFIKNINHLNIKSSKVFIKLILKLLKNNKSFYSDLIKIQYEIYYLYLDYVQTDNLNEKFLKNSLIYKVFEKDEIHKLFCDLSENKNIQKYQCKIVKFLLKNISGKNLIEEFYRIEEEDYERMSKKEINRFKKAKVVLTQNNFAELTYSSENFEYLKYLSLFCIEKIKEKFINTSC